MVLKFVSFPKHMNSVNIIQPATKPTFPDIGLDYLDVLVPVWPGMLVVETQTMHYLVGDPTVILSSLLHWGHSLRSIHPPPLTSVFSMTFIPRSHMFVQDIYFNVISLTLPNRPPR